MGVGQVRNYVDLGADGKSRAWERAGSYPTEYCMRFHDDRKAHTISLDGLVHRAAD